MLPPSEQTNAAPSMCDTSSPGHLSAATTGRAATKCGSVPPGKQPTGEAGEASARGTPEVVRLLIIVQNLPVPFDRRVWLECQALTSAGYRGAVVCPKGKGDPGHQVIDGG